MITNFWAIIPAAGLGKRMNVSCPKQYLSIDGKTILQQSIEVLLSIPLLEKILVVVAADDPYWPAVQAALQHPKISTAIGGEERFNTVHQGLKALAPWAKPRDWILVHDAVRPWVKKQAIEGLINELQNHEVGGLLGIPCRDTLKRSNEQGNIIETLSRQGIWLAQTPQMFRYEDLCQAFEKVITEKIPVTDEASAIELLGKTPRMVLGHPDNIKITYPEDLSL